MVFKKKTKRREKLHHRIFYAAKHVNGRVLRKVEVIYSMYQKFPDSEFNNDITSPHRLTCMISSNVFVKLEELTTGKEAKGPEQ
jgi:hypothetical protein